MYMGKQTTTHTHTLTYTHKGGLSAPPHTPLRQATLVLVVCRGSVIMYMGIHTPTHTHTQSCTYIHTWSSSAPPHSSEIGGAGSSGATGSVIIYMGIHTHTHTKLVSTSPHPSQTGSVGSRFQVLSRLNLAAYSVPSGVFTKVTTQDIEGGLLNLAAEGPPVRTSRLSVL